MTSPALLFAVSGFLLCGGPAVLSSSLSGCQRMFWLLGEGAGLAACSRHQRFRLAACCYAVLLCRRRRQAVRNPSQRRSLTAIYNVEPAVVESALEEICQQFGLRSGSLRQPRLVFGVSLTELLPPRPLTLEGIQGPHSLPLTGRQLGGTRRRGRPHRAERRPRSGAVRQQQAHVTLHWDPSNSRLRPLLEAELERRLALAEAPAHETGLWLNLAGFGLMGVVGGDRLRTDPEVDVSALMRSIDFDVDVVAIDVDREGFHAHPGRRRGDLARLDVEGRAVPGTDDAIAFQLSFAQRLLDVRAEVLSMA